MKSAQKPNGARFTGPRVFFRPLFACLSLVGFITWLSLPMAHAQKTVAPTLKISQPIAPPTRPGQPNAAAFLEISNPGSTADRLIGFVPAKDIAQRGELHVMKHEQGVMMMREVDGFDIPAGASITLSPGGNHLMLMDIKKQLKEGDEFSGLLRFEKAGDIKVTVKVGAPKSTMKGHGSAHRH